MLLLAIALVGHVVSGTCFNSESFWTELFRNYREFGIFVPSGVFHNVLPSASVHALALVLKFNFCWYSIVFIEKLLFSREFCPGATFGLMYGATCVFRFCVWSADCPGVDSRIICMHTSPASIFKVSALNSSVLLLIFAFLWLWFSSPPRLGPVTLDRLRVLAVCLVLFCFFTSYSLVVLCSGSNPLPFSCSFSCCVFVVCVAGNCATSYLGFCTSCTARDTTARAVCAMV